MSEQEYFWKPDYKSSNSGQDLYHKFAGNLVWPTGRFVVTVVTKKQAFVWL
jgi:hypothetical protein